MSEPMAQPEEVSENKPALEAVQPNTANEAFIAEARFRGAASWFYWIAGLSLINSALLMNQGPVHFLAGLGLTDVIMYFSQSMGNAGIAIVLNVLIAGMFVALGKFSIRLHTPNLWVYGAGMALYFLDGFIVFYIQNWWELAFHAYVLFRLFSGIKTAQDLQRLQQQ